MIRRRVLFLIATHNRSRKNIIECEIDGPVKKEGWRRINLIAMETEAIRMMSDDFGMRARKS
jgi:hypothetical protein